jgi:hypothetical protein
MIRSLPSNLCLIIIVHLPYYWTQIFIAFLNNPEINTQTFSHLRRRDIENVRVTLYFLFNEVYATGRETDRYF